MEIGLLRHQPEMTRPIGSDHFVCVLEADDKTGRGSSWLSRSASSARRSSSRLLCLRAPPDPPDRCPVPLADLEPGDARVFLGIVLPIDGARALCCSACRGQR
jgi:hypothetical protein